MRIPVFIFCFLACASVCAQTAWINEFHYDDAGADSLEFVEVIADEALSDVRVYLFNGATGLPYDSVLLDTLAASLIGNGLRISAWYPDLIQNGPADGICLTAGPTVLQALAYEGTFVSAGGSLPVLTFTPVEVGETTYTPENHAVQLYGIGSAYRHFEWITAPDASPGSINARQELSHAPVIYAAPADSLRFDVTPYGHSSAGQQFILRGSNITGPVRIYPPQGFEADTLEYFQTRAAFGEYLEIEISGDYLAPTPVYVRFTPVLPDGLDHSGNLEIREDQSESIQLLLLGTEGLVGIPRMWINEFHYDNQSYDTLEFVEIALQHAQRYVPEEISLHLYNGGNGKVYKSYTLAQAWQTGFSDPSWDLYVIDVPQIQNGPDALALCYRDSCTQLISYEGVFTATDGPAFGQTSRDILVAELPDTPLQSSLQLMGSGKFIEDFTWVYVPGGHTMGYPNNSQVLPIRLVSYRAAQTENGVQVDWNVFDEANGTQYRLELSSDGEIFDVIGTVAGNQSDWYRYSYHYPGAHYLRCMRIDAENNPHWFFTLRVPAQAELFWQLGQPDLLYHSYDLPADAEVQLYQVNGKLIRRQFIQLSGNRTRIGWLQDLAAGVYVLTVRSESETRNIRFIRQPR